MKKQVFGKQRRGLESKKLRTKKRRRLISFVLIFIAIPVLIIAGLSYLSYLDFFQIKNIEVAGNQTIDAQTLTALAESSLSQPIWYIFSNSTVAKYPKEQIKANISSSSPRIKSTHVGTKGFKTLEIVIVERSVQAVWCSDTNECFYIDDAGLLYEATSTDSMESHFTFHGYTEDNHVPYLKNALDFVRGLEHLNFEPVSMRITPEADADVLLKSGLILKIALQDNVEGRIDVIRTLMTDQIFKQKIADKKLSYVDLRFGNKIYYKEKSGGKVKSVEQSN